MKRTLAFVFLLTCPALLWAQTGTHEEGTIIRMHLTECVGPQHGFMSTMSGSGGTEPGAPCPEYVLVADKVVYVISGRSSDQLLPLAEVTRFRLQKNEMLIRIDDAAKESHFHIKAMALREEWERNQMLQETEANAAAGHSLEPAVLRSRP